MLRGDRLKRLREQNRFTQEDMASQVGVTTMQIYRWEHNKSDITSDALVKLARLFGVSTDYLLGLDTSKAEPETWLEKKILGLLKEGDYLAMIQLAAEEAAQRNKETEF